MVGFRRIEARRLYEGVVEQVLDLIREGKLTLGERLPSERELEQLMGVSRGVLREAFRVLEAQGLVESRPGGGRFLRGLPQTRNQTHSPDLALEQAAILDYWEVREALEVKSAELAAIRASKRDVEKLKLLVDRREASQEIRESLAIETEFHQTIARISQNRLLYRLLEEYAGLMSSARERVIERLQGGRGTIGFQRDDIMPIAVAIEAGDGAQAASLMRRHLEHTRKKYERPLGTRT